MENLYDAQGNKLNLRALSYAPYYIPDEGGALDENGRVHQGWGVAELYAAWDQLMDAHSEYITKTVADYPDSSGTYELRRYVMQPESGAFERTIYIQAGAHGNETAGQLSLLRIAQIICEDWKTNEKIAYLRNKVRIVLNPLVNPWGKTNTSTASSLGINVNRNYDGDWQKIGGGSGYNSGDYPFQNNENRWVRDTVEWIGPHNIHYAYDFHDAGTISEHGDYWINFDAFSDLSRNRIMQLVRYLCEKNVEGAPNVWHCADTASYGTFAQWTRRTLGVPSSTVEHCYGRLYMDADFMNRAVEAYFNAILETATANFCRPLDLMPCSRFALKWFGALAEKEFCLTTGNSAFSTMAGVCNLFDSIVDGGYITKSEVSVTDSQNQTLHYYVLAPKTYDKTLVLFGGLSTVRTNLRISNGIFYKLALMLRDLSDRDSHLAWLREHVRIIIIPYVTTDSTTPSGDAYIDYYGNFSADGVANTGKASVAAMQTFLEAIGNVDGLIYTRDRFAEDIDAAPAETWLVPQAQIPGLYDLQEWLNKTNVDYQIAATTGSMGDWLNAQNIKSVRIDSTYDAAAYAQHAYDYPSADNGIEAVDKTKYMTLNGETMRRLTVLVNLAETVLGHP